MGILDLLASGQIGGDNGTTGTATVPAGAMVIGASAASTAGGTVAIVVGGPNQAGATKTVTIPAGDSWSLPLLAGLGQIGGGSTLTFAGTDAYDVWWVKARTGA